MAYKIMLDHYLSTTLTLKLYHHNDDKLNVNHTGYLSVAQNHCDSV